MKRIFYVAFFLLAFSFPSFAFASVNYETRTEDNLQVSDDIIVTNENLQDILNTPKVDEKEKIYDFADLFTLEEEEKLFNSVNNYINKSKMDMVIVTINKNNKSSAEAYGQDFYDYNYFGKDKYYSGLLFLIDMENRDFIIVTTGYAQLMYDSNRIESILDYVFDDMVESNYYSASSKFVSSSLNYYNSGFPSDASHFELDIHGNVIAKKAVNWPLTIILSLFFPSFIVWIFISKHKGIKLAYDADMYFDKDNIIKGNSVDRFITTHTSRIRINNSSSGGSGGHSHSSSFGGSHGSSGRSHGGGGRHF